MFFRAGFCGFSGNENRDGQVDRQDASRYYENLFYVARKFLEPALVLLHPLLDQGRNVSVSQSVHRVCEVLVLVDQLGAFADPVPYDAPTCRTCRAAQAAHGCATRCPKRRVEG